MSTIKDDRFVATMFPLVATEGSVGFNSIKRSEIKTLINSHLKMLMLTNPGELISDSAFGVGLYQMLFLNESEQPVLDLRKNIKQQISKYMSYLTKYRVLIDTSKLDNNQLGVRIEYKLDNELEVAAMTFVADGSSVTVYNDSSQGTTNPILLEQILRERS